MAAFDMLEFIQAFSVLFLGGLISFFVNGLVTPAGEWTKIGVFVVICLVLALMFGCQGN